MDESVTVYNGMSVAYEITMSKPTPKYLVDQIRKLACDDYFLSNQDK